MHSNIKYSKTKLLIFFVVCAFSFFALSLFLSSCGSAQSQNNFNIQEQSCVSGLKHYDGYTLEQSTIVSRHNLRSAIAEEGDPLHNNTSVEWMQWSSSPGDLSVQGGDEETIFGQYFRRYFESENLIEENYQPTNNEVYFLSNSNQRTIATANFFAQGLLPVANINVNFTQPLGSNNPIFSRKITKSSNEFKEQVKKEILEANNVSSYEEISRKLEPNFKKLEDLVGFKDSNVAKEKNIESLPLDDIDINLEFGVGQKMKGTLRTGNIIVDALKMQFYQEEDDSKSVFNKKINKQDLMDIFWIDEVYQRTLFDTYTLGVDRSNLLLKEIQNDMKQKDRKISFLCGHDNTLMALLASLDVAKYELENTIDKRIPIGSKLVINKYKDSKGEEYCSLNLVYETVNQIRHHEILDMDNPPCSFDLELNGLNKNSQGLYKLSDVESRISDSIEAYNKYQ